MLQEQGPLTALFIVTPFPLGPYVPFNATLGHLGYEKSSKFTKMAMGIAVWIINILQGSNSPSYNGTKNEKTNKVPTSSGLILGSWVPNYFILFYAKSKFSSKIIIVYGILEEKVNWNLLNNNKKLGNNRVLYGRLFERL